ncbi:MAG TPA: Xaa-Pro aminopeptidase [Gemmatimonadaceae bacterium]|nr:Xaa-Pro aminopeptidase [Gemmatimonadaceae bacterium]
MNRLLFVVLLALPFKVDAQITAREYAQRREQMAARLPDQSVLVVLGAREPAQDYLEFNQNPGMMYLTGIAEPDAALVMVKASGQTSATLFVLPRDPAAETWTGTRLGAEGATKLTGLPARLRSALPQVLDSLASTKSAFFVVGDLSQNPSEGALTVDDQFVGAFKSKHPEARVTVANETLEQLRGKKSPAELALIKKAVDITVEAQKEAIKAVRPDKNEYEIEALIEYVFRRSGSERPSFATIVGSGPNSTTLHYNADDRQMQPGEVVVMDIGASYEGYAADVTRTVPTSGTFSAEQRQVYQIVRDAQAAAERQAKPGKSAQLMTDSATALIAAGLTHLGLIESPDATVDLAVGGGSTRQLPQYMLYYMHGLGHGIGLEVHDPDQFYFTGTIAEGSAFTIEPGIYVRPNLLETLPDTPRNRALIAKIRPAVERYKSIGVRIEDDYIITDKGVEWISRAPREISEIEALMRRPSF